jgi:hypothetical protein
MAWSTPYSPTTGDVVSAANLTTYKDDLTYLQARKGARVYKGVAQTIATATGTAIQFGASDTESYDPLAMHDPVTNNTRLTVPTGYDGIWIVVGILGWAANATGRRITSIFKNGVEVAQIQAPTLAAGQNPTYTVTYVGACVASDYFELRGFQDSGGNLNTLATEQTVSLAAHWLSA